MIDSKPLQRHIQKHVVQGSNKLFFIVVRFLHFLVVSCDNTFVVCFRSTTDTIFISLSLRDDYNKNKTKNTSVFVKVQKLRQWRVSFARNNTKPAEVERIIFINFCGYGENRVETKLFNSVILISNKIPCPCLAIFSLAQQ